LNTFLVATFFGTFILEDAALAGALGLVARGDITLFEAVVVCFLGISIGDLGLYAIGAVGRKMPLIRDLEFVRRGLGRFESRGSTASLSFLIFASRLVPGTRLPTYLAAGFLRFPAIRFFVLTVISVGIWVGLVLGGGAGVVHALAKANPQSPILTAAFLLVGFFWLRGLLPKLLDPWSRKALLHSWRRWTHFEFWPAWFFYIPIGPYYIYRSIRGGSPLLPFYANPQIDNGGIIGESKWDFLQHLPLQDDSTLASVLLETDQPTAVMRATIHEAGISIPFILKPDIGQRGYGVRIIKSESELDGYIVSAKAKPGMRLIAQKLSRWPSEAGIFYYRLPSESQGKIFSITDKKFPALIADGETKFGDLILRDRRARIIAPVYFERHRKNLDRVFPKGERVVLSECGNHCQGAIFVNGGYLNGDRLAKRIDAIAKTIPDFYFGRFDIRYDSEERLRRGEAFEIVEVNGAGSEATHIWDPQTGLLEAYEVLFQQWKILFEIGRTIRDQRRTDSKVSVLSFLRESARVFRRRDSLSTSS
jgi:membrane protein DedA with SNARE-associated domain